MKLKQTLLITSTCFLIILVTIVFYGLVDENTNQSAPTELSEFARKQAKPPSANEEVPSEGEGYLNVEAEALVDSRSDPPAAEQTTKPPKHTVLKASEGGSLAHQMPPLPRGEALIRLNDRQIAPENLHGHYQRVLIGSETETRVELNWSGLGADRPVFVHAIHGGLIDGEKGGTYYTKGDGQLAFNFKTTHEAGRYEILLRSGASEEVLHFWVPMGVPEVDRYGL